MLLNTAPLNEAIVSNVGEIGEFRIRNSAKAFNILSSGLYANKIRAIIRELSCNAVDSHVAAGKKDTPFDVHLPSTMEPWFSIRDYGTGLNHEQVTNIYTTYFESTKTDSNDYIGALGLGSKSPFSYTDNFTVTTVKNGVKGIYTAFINDTGVPSIALMSTETDCTEPNGVEVKFSVNDRWDFDKFAHEARHVYKHFKLRPANIKVDDVIYIDKDIVPGVHTATAYESVAVMGNIAYPIDVPNPESNLGDLAGMLRCGLVIEFNIGELDFQASREGLSYIPQTIASIKRKLIEVQSALSLRIAEEAKKYSNMWERGLFLRKKANERLWGAAVRKYAVDSKFPLSNLKDVHSFQLKTFEFTATELAKKYNIELRGFHKPSHQKSVNELKQQDTYDYVTKKYVRQWNIRVDSDVCFVKNDLKTGAIERAKYHWKTSSDVGHLATVYIISAADKTKPVAVEKFLKLMCSPPNVKVASELMAKERAKSNLGANVTILNLEKRNQGGWGREDEMVWRDAGKADSFSDTDTHYYLPLKGFEVESIQATRVINAKELFDWMRSCGIAELQQIKLYGVRKTDIKFIKEQKNWVNIETYIQQVLSKINATTLAALAMQSVELPYIVHSTQAQNIKDKITEKDSPYVKLVNQFANVGAREFNAGSLENLSKVYNNNSSVDVNLLVTQLKAKMAEVFSRYPMLKSIERYNIDVAATAEYINLVDASKGV